MTDQEIAQHLAHCNQGEYIGGCKYGPSDTTDCPALKGRNTMQHTPGPWNVINNVYGHSRLAIMQPSGVMLAEVVDWPDEAMTEANARLIAAAPDLLAACEMAINEQSIGVFGAISNECISMLRSVLAKACGTAA